MLRRLRFPLPLTARRCRCGRLLDSYGHHRAACARVGVLGRRGFALETAAARVCREAGGRVMTNMFVRELDLAPGVNTTDGRFLEVVDSLSLFQGAQLAIATTLVSALRADGTPRPRAATTSGAALDDARTREETTCPELVSEGSWAKLVVLAAEVSGRWSAETAQFLGAIGGVQSTVSARDCASVRGARLVPPLEKVVGLHRGESFRKFAARAPLSCLCCR